MVDDIDNQVDGQRDPMAWDLPLLLLGAFRTLVDDANERLAAAGFGGVRPAHGFALQAVGDGASTTEVARRLGISKQAAAKTLAGLEAEGWVTRAADPADARKRTVVLTERGTDLLHSSVAAFGDVASEWGLRVGHREIGHLRRILTELNVVDGIRLDLGSWSS